MTLVTSLKRVEVANHTTHDSNVIYVGTCHPGQLRRDQTDSESIFNDADNDTM